MTKTEIHHIIKELTDFSEKMTEYSETAQADAFLSCYDNSPDFLHFSADGKMRNYEEFQNICAEYYDSIKEQKIVTLQNKIHVFDANLVVSGWTGNIIARCKSGDIMKMDNYSVTNVFKKTDNKWKVIHAHESSLPPEIIKKES